MTVICTILFKVGFDLESMSICMHPYLLYIISKYWVRLRYLSGLESSSGSGAFAFVFFFWVHRQLVVDLAYARKTKDQSVQSTKCAPGSIVALLSNICSRNVIGKRRNVDYTNQGEAGVDK